MGRTGDIVGYLRSHRYVWPDEAQTLLINVCYLDELDFPFTHKPNGAKKIAGNFFAPRLPASACAWSAHRVQHIEPIDTTAECIFNLPE